MHAQWDTGIGILFCHLQPGRIGSRISIELSASKMTMIREFILRSHEMLKDPPAYSGEGAVPGWVSRKRRCHARCANSFTKNGFKIRINKFPDISFRPLSIVNIL